VHTNLLWCARPPIHVHTNLLWCARPPIHVHTNARTTNFDEEREEMRGRASERERDNDARTHVRKHARTRARAHTHTHTHTHTYTHTHTHMGDLCVPCMCARLILPPFLAPSRSHSQEKLDLLNLVGNKLMRESTLSRMDTFKMIDTNRCAYRVLSPRLDGTRMIKQFDTVYLVPINYIYIYIYI